MARRAIVLVSAVAVALTVLCCPSARAGWSPDGATVLATSASLRPIAACPDAAHGAIVVWHEEQSGASGVLRALRVLASGDVDPAWPAGGALVCGALAARGELGTLADGAGGAYVWWKEGAALYLTRLDASGAGAAGWPARGRLLGTVNARSPRPSVIRDAGFGIYVAWLAASANPEDGMTVLATHLGPANVGADGWPNGARTIVPATSVQTLETWPQLALAADGGVFVAWASQSLDEAAVPSAWRLRRLAPDGTLAAGWPADGLDFGAFHGELLDGTPESALLALSADGRGGVFLLIGDVVGADEGDPLIATRLRRLLGDGSAAAGWSAGGVAVDPDSPVSYQDASADRSVRVLADGRDGAIYGLQVVATHTSAVRYAAVDAVGAPQPGKGAFAEDRGHELVANGSGGAYVASFSPDGPSGPYQPNAFLSVTQLDAPGGFFEWHDDPVIHWYGDIALASSGDGGAIFFWSQAHQRFGLFARRFNTGGEVTGVGDGPFVAGLRGLRFVPGAGVRARLAFQGEARLDLYDVGGRRVASQRFGDAGGSALDVTLAGTAALPSGLYFARLSGAAPGANGRVVVSR